MDTPQIASAQEWATAWADMLVQEKELTRARDALAAKRRRMPWTPVQKTYRFEGPDGPATLLDLFAGRRQLIVYRAFMDPGVGGSPDHGCVGCSLMADHIGNLSHLNARDTTLAYVSRGPQADIARIKTRMGWNMLWYTMIPGEDGMFDVDSASTNGTAPMPSRQENWEDSPPGYPQTAPYQWWRHHDLYP